MSVGEKIKLLREQKGFTQEDLASAIKTTKQTIYKYETGIITNIPLDKLEKIAQLLNVPAAYLAGWDKETQYQLSNNDAMAKIIIKMRKDRNFFKAVKILNDLDEDKLDKATQILALL
jgi:transcriptional regulator with XRE-family HTH domain